MHFTYHTPSREEFSRHYSTANALKNLKCVSEEKYLAYSLCCVFTLKEGEKSNLSTKFLLNRNFIAVPSQKHNLG